MKISSFPLRGIAALLAFATMVSGSPLASAVNLQGTPMSVQQYGTGSAFNHGLVVSAWTNYNNLFAGGTFSAQCNDPATLAVTGERFLSSSTLGVGRNSLVVTIPYSLPGLSNMSGWAQVSAETDLACNYRWTAFAQESGYTIGAGGISFQVGNGIARDGGTVDFTMYRGLTANGGGGCRP